MGAFCITSAAPTAGAAHSISTPAHLRSKYGITDGKELR